MFMLDRIACLVILLVGGYFLALGIASLALPGRAARFLTGFASSAKVHYLELAIRMAAGLAFLQYAPKLPASIIFTIFGALLVSTTAILVLVPPRLHRRFAEWTVPEALRYLKLLGFVSTVAGLLILFVTVRSLQ
jgi:hypothetical protein